MSAAVGHRSRALRLGFEDFGPTRSRGKPALQGCSWSQGNGQHLWEKTQLGIWLVPRKYRRPAELPVSMESRQVPATAPEGLSLRFSFVIGLPSRANLGVGIAAIDVTEIEIGVLTMSWGQKYAQSRFHSWTLGRWYPAMFFSRILPIARPVAILNVKQIGITRGTTPRSITIQCPGHNLAAKATTYGPHPCFACMSLRQMSQNQLTLAAVHPPQGMRQR